MPQEESVCYDLTRVANVETLADLSAELKNIAAAIQRDGPKAVTRNAPDVCNFDGEAEHLKCLIAHAERKGLVVGWMTLLEAQPPSPRGFLTAFVHVAEQQFAHVEFKPAPRRLVDRVVWAVELAAEWIWQAHMQHQERDRQIQELDRRTVATPDSFLSWLITKLGEIPPLAGSYATWTCDPHGPLKRKAYRLARNAAQQWGFPAPPAEPAGALRPIDAHRAIDALRVWVEESLVRRAAAPRNKRMGRRPKFDRKKDEKLHQDYQASGMRNIKDFARERRLDYHEINAAFKRVRARRSRNK